MRKNFKRKPKFVTLLLKFFLVIVISMALWNGLHKSPEVPSDIFPYLTNLPADLVIQSQRDGMGLSSTSWADLIAVRSTVSGGEQHYLVGQLQRGIPIKDISLQNGDVQIPSETLKQILWRRDILLSYPFYEPKRFLFPVTGGTVWFIDTFGADREGGARRHEGTDIFGAEGLPIISVCDGEIEKLGWNRLGGERVGVRGEDGNYYYYAHLQMINPDLQLGQKVEKGDFLGTLGHTGDALTTPDHLHFGIELPNGEWVNPYPFTYVWQQSEA